jgi:LuxR family transcriptional regulator, maltose regulon positive regulatory protein
MISDSSSRLPLGQDVRPMTTAPTPLLAVPRAHQIRLVAAFLLGIVARDTLDHPDAGGPGRHVEAASPGEIRVLRYLQTNLSAREIADELYISVNTVKTHQRHLYRKLGAHSRTQAVERARALGLLGPAGRLEARSFRRNHTN